MDEPAQRRQAEGGGMNAFETSDGLTIGIGRTDIPGIFTRAAQPAMIPVVRAAAEPGNQRLTSNAFLGLLLPYHIHNINNMLVGVLGNTELASMFLPDNIARAVPKVREAAESAGGVTRFLRDLSEATHPNLDKAASDPSPLSRLARFIALACGRSIATDGLKRLESLPIPENREPSSAFGALVGMGAWAVLSLGGAGTVAGSGGNGMVKVSWSRPAGAGEPMLPGSEMADSVIHAAGGLAGRAGCLLRVEALPGSDGWAALESMTDAR